MFDLGTIPLALGVCFVLVSLIAFFFLSREKNALDSRLEDLDQDFTPKTGTKSASRKSKSFRQPEKKPGEKSKHPDSIREKARLQIQTRLRHAGIYSDNAIYYFALVKWVLITLPWGLALTAFFLELAKPNHILLFGITLSGFGMIAPSMWLESKKTARHNSMRRTLPDILDLIVISLDTGQTISVAFRDLAQEVRHMHPVLGREFEIVQWEVQLGRSLSEALFSFADRSDFDEIRSLAGLIEQNERFGVGLAKALRVQAEMLRFKHIQMVEEKAQKASTKIIFPTMLFIFPGIFCILLGPAAMQIRAIFK